MTPAECSTPATPTAQPRSPAWLPADVYLPRAAQRRIRGRYAVRWVPDEHALPTLPEWVMVELPGGSRLAPSLIRADLDRARENLARRGLHGLEELRQHYETWLLTACWHASRRTDRTRLSLPAFLTRVRVIATDQWQPELTWPDPQLEDPVDIAAVSGESTILRHVLAHDQAVAEAPPGQLAHADGTHEWTGDAESDSTDPDSPPPERQAAQRPPPQRLTLLSLTRAVLTAAPPAPRSATAVTRA